MAQTLQMTQEDVKDAQIRVLDGQIAFLKDELIQAVATATALSKLLTEKEATTESDEEIPPSPS